MFDEEPPRDEHDECRWYIRRLELALDELLRLSRHYAKLLNTYDGGERVIPESRDAWIARLEECGKLQEPTDAH